MVDEGNGYCFGSNRAEVVKSNSRSWRSLRRYVRINNGNRNRSGGYGLDKHHEVENKDLEAYYIYGL